MSTTTTKYGFIKPEKTDPANITATNENWDKLDAELVKRSHDLSMDGHKITDVAEPVNGSDVATRHFVEQHSIEGNTYVATDYSKDGNVTLKPYVADEDELTFKSHIANKDNPHGVTIQQIGAAPSGYGLGEVIGKPCTDCNTAVLNGFYQLSGADTVNVPDDMRFSPMLVERRWSLIVQTITNNKTSVKRYSTDTGSTWSEWEYVNPPMVRDKEYRTTERTNNGQALYTKEIAFGNLVNNAVKRVNIGANYNIVKIDGWLYTGNVTVPLLAFKHIDDIFYDKQQGTLSIGTSVDLSGYTAVVVVKYTK